MHTQLCTTYCPGPPEPGWPLVTLRTRQVGYKNMMATRRSSWRTCQNVEDQAEGGDKDLYAQYRGMVSSEIAKIIDMVVDDAVSKYTKGPLAAKKRENLVFFHKM